MLFPQKNLVSGKYVCMRLGSVTLSFQRAGGNMIYQAGTERGEDQGSSGSASTYRIPKYQITPSGKVKRDISFSPKKAPRHMDGER